MWARARYGGDAGDAASSSETGGSMASSAWSCSTGACSDGASNAASSCEMGYGGATAAWARAACVETSVWLGACGGLAAAAWA